MTLFPHIATSPSYEELIQRFWNIEKVASTQCHTPEEQVTVDHFHATHSFLSSGIYEVSLPKKPDALSLGESRTQALNRFKTN